MAVFAACDRGRIIELWFDHRRKSSSDQSENALLCNFVAGTYTEIAENALILVPLDRDQFCLHKARMLLALQSGRADLHAVRTFDQSAVMEVMAAAL